MSYSTLPAPADLFGVNSALRSRAFSLTNDHPRDSDSHSPMSEPRSPIFRPSLTAEFPPHLATFYNSPYAAAAVAAAVAGRGARGVTTSSPFGPYGRPQNAAAFYPGMVAGEPWRRSPYLSQLDLWPHLRSLEAVVGPRTKAPREATSILKSWLNEHKDNPYPTKSEKMTLSLVTHMTLTQVSTWFANARRRIKKENKMTWTPKTRCGERDGSSSNEEENEKDFFGARRPSFSIPYPPDGAIRHSSVEYDDGKKATDFDQSAAGSSRPYQQDFARKPSAHPLFAAFTAGLHSQYGKSPGGSLENALKQGMFSDQKELTQARLTSEEGSSSSGSGQDSCQNDAVEEKHEKQRLRASCEQMFDRDRPCLLPFTEPARCRLAEQSRPFVQVGKGEGSDEQGCDKGNSTEENASEPGSSASSKRSSAYETYSAAIKIEQNALKKEASSREEGEPATPEERKEHASEKETCDSNLYRAFNMAGDFTARSNANENMNSLARWIRDFQKLVASGQEHKATQVLAKALSVAAKAGACSRMDAERKTPEDVFPSAQPGDGACFPSGIERYDAPSPQRSRTFRYSPTNSSRRRRSSRSNDSASMSPEINVCRSASPRVRPVEDSILHASSDGSNDAPMNLTLPVTSKDWMGDVIAEDAPIEA